MMCGRFLEPVPKGYAPVEWNAVGDAHASSIVYAAQVKIHRSIGLDVTSQVHMAAPEFRRIFRDIPLFGPILDWAEVWFRDYPGSTFHDPLAAATIFEPSLCTYRAGNVAVDLVPGDSFGLTRWTPGEASAPHTIADAVDASRFFAHFLSVVTEKAAA